MKRFLITCIIVGVSCMTFAQNFYWTVYDFKIKNGQESEVLGAIDKFMKTETGKTMPTAFVSAFLFANSEQKATHRIVFLSEDRAAFGKMYSGVLQQKADFQLMSSSMDQGSSNVGSYLGKSLHSTPPAQNNYGGAIALTVSDPATYLSAFKTFSSEVHAKWGGKLDMSLHQFISGQERGVTHIVVFNTATFEDYLRLSDEIYQSQSFKNFNDKVKDIRKVVSNTSSVTLARYNVPG